MSKELRVLTGFHAGARLQLNATAMTIGAQATADIVIHDWSEDTMQIAIDTQGQASIGAAGDAAGAVALDDFAARRFGDVALCAGPSDAPWPSDLQLLQSMLSARGEPRKYDGETPDAVHPGHAPAPSALRGRRGGWSRIALMAMLAASAGSGALVLVGGRTTQAAERPPHRPTMADLQRALAELHDDAITLQAQAGGFVATGVVDTAAAAHSAQTRLAAIAGKRLHWQVRPADDIARALAESLHEPHVKVRYAGAAHFEVSGSAHDPAALHEIVERFRADMRPLALSFAVAVARTDQLGVKGKVDSALASDTVKYVESSDGTKNFVAEISGDTTFH